MMLALKPAAGVASAATGTAADSEGTTESTAAPAGATDEWAAPGTDAWWRHQLDVSYFLNDGFLLCYQGPLGEVVSALASPGHVPPQTSWIVTPADSASSHEQSAYAERGMATLPSFTRQSSSGVSCGSP